MMEYGTPSTSTAESAPCEEDGSVLESNVEETHPNVETLQSDTISCSRSKLLPHNCWDLSLWKFTNTATATAKVDAVPTQLPSSPPCISCDIIVDIIIPVHNASSTIRETVASAMNQIWLSSATSSSSKPIPNIAIHICCYNDASTDDSWLVLQELHENYSAVNPPFSLAAESSTPNGDAIVSIDNASVSSHRIPTHLWISSSPTDGTAHGPGYARNRAVQMRDTIITSQYTTTSTVTPIEQHFLCWLDSDDIMHPTRVYYQVHTMMQLQPAVRLKTLLGTNFDRFISTEMSSNNHSSPGDDNHPASSTITPHYTKWANELPQERLYLERFREVTIIQPTWMMCRYRYTHILHGYLECPLLVVPDEQAGNCPSKAIELSENDVATSAGTSLLSSNYIPCKEQLFSEWIRNVPSQLSLDPSGEEPWRLVHTEVETLTTIRVAEDLRFFHEHLSTGGRLQRTRRTSVPLVSYRHRPGVSQSALTSRKLLLALRVVAFEQMILFHSSLDKTNLWNDKFIIWGAGRDGKDFFKALSLEARQKVYCFVDVDDAKISRGFYNYFSPNVLKKKQTALNIPIIHFSLAARDSTRRAQLYDSWKMSKHVSHDSDVLPHFGRITKNQDVRINASTHNETTRSHQSKRIKIAPNNTEKIDPGVKSIDVKLLPNLPVVVCVAMYRTDGALESNVNLIDRVEGKDLWYFS